MSDATARYVTHLQERIARLARDNAEKIDQAALQCADALEKKRVIHIYDTGHIISHEMIMRTGGLAAYTHLSFDGTIDNSNLWRTSDKSDVPLDSSQVFSAEQSLIQWLFAQNTLRQGDILVIGSVSGVGLRLVELAIQAKAQGLYVIAMTSVTFSSRLNSKHPSGKRLYEVADLVLDNQAEYGDADFSIPGSDKKICPFSGIAATILMWSLTAGIVERLVQRGIQPSIYESVNLPDGPQLVETVQNNYKRNGI